MSKRIQVRGIKSAQPYSLQEAADALGVSLPTIRSWIKAGLPALTSHRPFLIIGAALSEFLTIRKRNKKSPLAQDQLYCLSCKEPKKPLGLLVDFIPQTQSTGRLVGLCPDCDTICNRMISAKKLPEFERIFDVACKGGS